MPAFFGIPFVEAIVILIFFVITVLIISSIYTARKYDKMTQVILKEQDLFMKSVVTKSKRQ